MTIDWAAIIAAIAEQIIACLNKNRPESRIKASLLDPDGFDWFIGERVIRKSQGMDRKQWRENGDAVMAAVRDRHAMLTADDADDLIERAKVTAGMAA